MTQRLSERIEAVADDLPVNSLPNEIADLKERLRALSAEVAAMEERIEFLEAGGELVPDDHVRPHVQAAPPVHCPACSGWLPWDIKTKRHDPCPGIAPAPMTPEEREAIELMTKAPWLQDPAEWAKATVTLRTLLSRTKAQGGEG